MYQIALFGKRMGGPLTWVEASGKVERLKWVCNGLEIKSYKGKR